MVHRRKFPFLRHFAKREPFSALFVFFMTYFLLAVVVAPLPIGSDADSWLESVIRLISIAMGLLAFFLNDREEEEEE